MPTENRSSNTEVVSELLPCPFCGEKPQITKHHREDIYSFMHRCPVLGPISWGFREDQQAHIEKWNARVKPAEQHQGDLVARYSMDQTGCEELNPDGPWVRYDDLNRDPGEVERLREENRVLQRQLGELWADVDELRAQLDDACEVRDILQRRSDNFDRTAQGIPALARAEKLRAQLAEAHALLKRCEMVVGSVDGALYEDLRALSASAEPTYPRVEIVRAHKHTCASCKEGAEHAPCDCGAIVDGVAVKVEPSAALERKP